MDWVNLSTILGVIVAFLFVGRYIYKLGRTMKGYEDHLEAIRKDLNTLSSTQKSFVDGFLKIFAALTTTLIKSGAVKKEDYPGLVKTFTEALGDSYKSAMSPLESPNPLSEDEKVRLRKYTEKAKKGEWFSPSEAKDFYDLTKRLSEERGSDAGVWILLLLAAFILGLILGSRD